MTDVRKVSPWRRFIAVLTSFVLAVMGAYAQGAVAHAEENSAIAFGPVTLTHVTETGDPVPAPGRQLIRGNFFFLDISFDATTANLLFEIRTDTGETLLLPAHSDLIHHADMAARTIQMEIPHGLLDL